MSQEIAALRAEMKRYKESQATLTDNLLEAHKSIADRLEEEEKKSECLQSELKKLKKDFYKKK